MRGAVALLALLAGCAGSVDPRGAQQQASGLAAERAGYRARWVSGGEEDEAVDRRVRELLGHELTVPAAVQIALLRNQGLVAMYEEIGVSQAELVQAGLLRNPRLDVSVAFPIAGTARTGVGLGVTTDFLSLFQLPARRRVATAQLDAVLRRVGAATIDLAHDVEAALFSLQAAEQSLALRRVVLEAGDAALDLARRQHAAGNSSDLDLASQQALFAQLAVEVERGAGEAAVARESLTRLLGLWGEEAGYRVTPRLPELPPDEPPLDHLERLAVGRRLDLAAAREDLHAATETLAMARNFRWIGADVGASLERSPEGFTTLGPTGSIELPLFDQKQALVARLEAMVRTQAAREQQLAVDVRSQVRSARGRLAAARRVVERYAQGLVPARQQVLALSQQQYDAMLLGVYQLIMAKQAAVSTYREFIEALRDYWLARVELARATGGPLLPDAPTMPSPASSATPPPMPSGAPAMPPGMHHPMPPHGDSR
jgi:cobalt-zinc-cadmium efflux system outer membrane protein